MARRITAPVMVGREAELAVLRGALAEARAGTTRSVLIGGESGIGKSRLAAELVAGARAGGWSIHQGACPPAAAGAPVPFAPFTAVLRSIVRSVDARLLDHLVGPGRRELAALLPELGDPDPGWVAGGGAARLFEAVLSLVERATRRGHGLVLVLEDLQWADAAARSLLAWLIGELRRVPVLLLATYRTDTDPGDPLPALLVELDRADGCERLELGALSHAEADRLLSAIGDETVDADMRAGIARRAGGIPLYLEELLSSGSGVSGPPGSVRVAVGRRLAGLDPAAARTAQLVAVAGRPVDPAVVGAVAGLAGEALDRAVTAGIDVGLLRVVDAGASPGSGEVVVRHALVGEALVAGLPPGLAARLHASWAALLMARPSLGPKAEVERTATIAGHLLATGDRDAAVPALIAAAEAAVEARGFASAHDGYERALAIAGDRLASLVPDVPAVLDAAAQAAWLAGVPARAIASGALAAELGGDAADPPTVLRRRVRMATYLAAAGASDRAIAELTAVVADAPPGRSRTRALLDLGRALTVAGDTTAATDRCAQALTEAQAAGDARTAARAGVALGVALSAAGRHAEAVEALTAARRQDEASPSVWSATGHGVSRLPDTLARSLDEAALLLHLGDVEGSLAAALHGHQVTLERGLTAAFGPIAAATVAWDLIRLGRWSEAHALLAATRPGSSGGGPTAGAWAVVAAWLAAARGAWVEAESHLASIGPGTIELLPGLRWAAIGAAAAAMTAAGQGRLREARHAVRAGLRGLDAHAAPSTVVTLALVGLAAEAEAATSARSRGDVAATDDALDAAAELAARALSSLGMATAQASPIGGVRREALVARVDAELARSAGVEDASIWERAVTTADEAGDPYAAASARLRLATVLLAAGDRGRATGDRGRAAGALSTAWSMARDLGATELMAAIERLARRARLPVGPEAAVEGRAAGPRDAALALGLSDREVDVLELLALGRTDREIAATLFITEKTAGHHVSHILAKLTVTRRGEAAALAHRLGLAGDGPARDPA